MHHTARFFLLGSFALALTASVTLALEAPLQDTASSGASPATPPAETADDATPIRVTDASIDPYRLDLLDLAFTAASKIPEYPHIKDRSRAQEWVVVACLELERPNQAIGYADRIDNWRRGAGVADAAHFLAERGDVVDLDLLLDVAAAEAAETEDWRRDRINTKIARAKAAAGRLAEAMAMTADVAPSETGKVDPLEHLDSDDEAIAALDERLATIRELNKIANFDHLRNALFALVRVYDRFYDRTDVRDRILGTITESWSSLPVPLRFELLASLARVATGHDDAVTASSIVDEAETLYGSFQWLPEYDVRILAQLAELRHEAGTPEHAIRLADASLERYEANEERIVNIYRARTLRPLAEANLTLGRRDVALELYRRAIEVGMINPNSRPRAEDLTATCCSMATHGLEPDETLWNRIRTIVAELDHPW